MHETLIMIATRLNLYSTHTLKPRVQVSSITWTERIRVQVGRIPNADGTHPIESSGPTPHWSSAQGLVD